MILLRLLLIISFTNAVFFFERDSYEFYISESAPIHTKIGFIKATSSSLLSSIQYELYGDINQTFQLNSSTGELILLNSLDYETITTYKLTIEARLSTIIAPCFTELTIHVLNTNDNPPEINLMFYPSVLFERNLLKYDLNTYSTALATINLKDIDESTKNLSLFINDTTHFQIQFVRQIKNGLITESIYILSTKNNSQLFEYEYYYVSFHSCDNDQPLLWTNRSYEFHLKPKENLCKFNQTNFILDIKENLPNRTLIFHRITNEFCQQMFYSIDDQENFYIQPQTGDLYTSTNFHREERSIYKLNLKAIDQYNKEIQMKLTIRILDEYDHIPFLIEKKFQINRMDFHSINLFNSTYCRYQTKIYNYFQLLSNCTLVKLSLPEQGKYLFYIQLNQKYNYEDTFLLELTSSLNETFLFTLIQSQWMIIIPIILGIFLILIIIICTMMMIRKRRYNKIHQNKQKSSSSSLSNSEENVHNKYDAIATLSKLKVHDDHELSPSPISTAIYLVQKSSSSLSPTRDDEGYSGSSDVSENPLPIETTIIAANQLIEQYRIHEFRTRQSILSYDVPKRSNTSCVSPDVSLV